MPPPADDAAVVARVLAGDTEQFSALVQRYQALLYRYAVSVVHDHDAAADMVQDAFVRAYTGLARCRDHDNFRAWIFRTLHNRCLDYLRDPRRRHTVLEAAGELVDAAEGPSARAERLRLRADIRQALEALPEHQREAFLLHYVEGLPYDEMARLLGASVSALKMRVLRAREALAAALQKREVTLDRGESSELQAPESLESRGGRFVSSAGTRRAPSVFVKPGWSEEER